MLNSQGSKSKVTTIRSNLAHCRAIASCACSHFSAVTVAKTFSEVFPDVEAARPLRNQPEKIPTPAELLTKVPIPKSIRVGAAEEIPFVGHEPKPELLSESAKQKPTQMLYARSNQVAEEKHTRKMP